jgi:hypothetical protein
MTSLDDVFEQMRFFSKALREFNEELRASASALSQAHDQTRGLWVDEAARNYLRVYEPLAQSLDEYLRGPAPRFEQFLDNKVRQLEQYLNGG